MSSLARPLGALGCAALFFASAQALAGPPQFGVGVTVGAAGVGKDHAIWDDTVFHLGARGDVMFRNGSRTFGIGPYVEVMTHDFGELQTGAGGPQAVRDRSGRGAITSASRTGWRPMTMFY